MSRRHTRLQEYTTYSLITPKVEQERAFEVVLHVRMSPARPPMLPMSARSAGPDMAQRLGKTPSAGVQDQVKMYWSSVKQSIQADCPRLALPCCRSEAALILVVVALPPSRSPACAAFGWRIHGTDSIASSMYRSLPQ